MTERLLQPVGVSEFFATYWGRRSIHLKGGPDRLGDRFGDTLPPDWSQWLDPMRPVLAAYRDDAGAQVEIDVAAQQAMDHFAAGRTICADVSTVPPVRAILDDLVATLRPFAGSPFAKLYASPDGGGFAPHFDGDHVFVAQLQGRKRWRYGRRPAVPGALVGGTLGRHGNVVHAYPRARVPVVGPDGRLLAPPDFDRMSSIDLAPGDVLYLPPGTWHVTEALGESVAVSFSPPRTPVLQLLLDALRWRLEARPLMLEDIVRPPTSRSELPQQVQSALRVAHGELRRLAEALVPDVLALHWAREAFAGAPIAAREPGALSPQTRLRAANGGFTWMTAPGSDGTPAVFVFRPSIEVQLPLQAAAFLTALPATRSFAVSEALAFDTKLCEEDARALLTELVAVGVLHICQEP